MQPSRLDRKSSITGRRPSARLPTVRHRTVDLACSIAAVATVEDFSGWGQLARVRYVEDEHRVYLALPNGQVGWADSEEPVSFEPGTVVLALDGHIEEAPEDAWSPDSWVAVVRIKADDTTVVEFGGHARIVPTNEAEYEVGNTVEVNATGVLRVLDRSPIRLLDLPEVDEAAIEEFIVTREQGGLTYKDFGGMPSVVQRARELIETPLKYGDRLRKIGARQVKGVLFTGDPGTGKTMLARIIAHESDATFYQVRGPEVVSKWYGQSEELLRRIFDHAGKQDSAIIFFDEIDSIAAQRDEDAHEASRRLVAQLLTLMDGFSSKGNVIVIATTNRPQDIDKALLRPGRFDWEINFPLPDRADREAILAASVDRMQKSGPLPHGQIADRTDKWTASHLAAIWSEAARLAATDGREAINAEDYFGGFECVDAQLRRVAGSRA